MNQRTLQQNKALHKGCQEIADVLIETNVTIQQVIELLEIRPTMELVKELYKGIAKAKYGVTSTTKLETHQITQVWEDLAYAVGQAAKVNIEFPSQESLMFNGLDYET